MKLTKDNYVAFIPWLSAEWTVSMKVQLYDEVKIFGSYAFCNIAEFTADDSQIQHGKSTLMVRMGKENNLRIESTSLYGPEAVFSYPPLVVDQPVHIEVHQRYMYGGIYRYTIVVDGVNYASKVVTNAQQNFNIKVYASEKYREACRVYVSDFKLTNFL